MKSEAMTIGDLAKAVVEKATHDWVGSEKLKEVAEKVVEAQKLQIADDGAFHHDKMVDVVHKTMKSEFYPEKKFQKELPTGEQGIKKGEIRLAMSGSDRRIGDAILLEEQNEGKWQRVCRDRFGDLYVISGPRGPSGTPGPVGTKVPDLDNSSEFVKMFSRGIPPRRLADALGVAFNWSTSEQGAEYWENRYGELVRGERYTLPDKDWSYLKIAREYHKL